MYGKVRKLVEGSLEDCPFRYQGMYFDEETELCYNRYRYYNLPLARVCNECRSE
ncbi:hypothetical protein B4Q04_21715 [Zobellia sp. OII3]|uniref:RHS repeat domain-containing protein n=1 Tax=Zobellia TaxID=112040 RepID=UPI000B534D32|nr:hypothetical protein B4Q04_21715 [Zobellia sp. OII3]